MYVDNGKYSILIQQIEIPPYIDCACVIHGDVYDWEYVEKLHSMLQRNLTPRVRLHVYTEESRTVPEPYIKHALENWWYVKGPKRSWWYKMQMFNTEYHAGPLLYFDLDVVITGDIDWIWQKPLNYFWTLRDFKHLWRPTYYGSNSSVMWWDTTKFSKIWNNFKKENLTYLIKKYRGDQDYISDSISLAQRKFLDADRIKSWRWQAVDGGFDFSQRRYLEPGTGTKITESLSVLVFHGHPKPKDLQDQSVKQHWQ